MSQSVLNVGSDDGFASGSTGCSLGTAWSSAAIGSLVARGAEVLAEAGTGGGGQEFMADHKGNVKTNNKVESAYVVRTAN